MIVRVDDLAHCGALEWDATWRIAMLVDSPYQSMCGRGERGAYTIKMSRQKCNWPMRIGDLISYAEADDRNVLLVLSQEEERAVRLRYQGHAYNDRFLREDEPKVLIHSTTYENWKQIEQDGCLKSWNCVKKENKTDEDQPIGHVLGDPEDFRDYIMFGSGVSCEMVVSSKQKGRLTNDIDEAYLSGARLYFDAQKIAEDGLLVRDGNHIKVKDCLPLQPYLLWTATWENVGLPAQGTTPRIFAETADKKFEMEQQR